MASFDAKDAGRVAKHIQKAVEESAQKALLSTAARIVGHIIADVIPSLPRPPVDRSAYRAGWRFTPSGDGAEVYNAMPYASIIEYGARAENIKVGRKMIDALAQWVLRKGLVARGRGKAAKAAAEVEARRMAWAIAMKMKAKGIFDEGKGLRVLEKALKMLPQFFAEEWRRECEKEG